MAVLRAGMVEAGYGGPVGAGMWAVECGGDHGAVWRGGVETVMAAAMRLEGEVGAMRGAVRRAEAEAGRMRLLAAGEKLKRKAREKKRMVGLRIREVVGRSALLGLVYARM